MPEGPNELKCLLEKIYRERGFDFREYKKTTLTRRLERRLCARWVKTYAEYAAVLDRDPSEYTRLFDDFTIKVTSFFRDKTVFRALEEVVLPALICQEGRDLRIWSAGCATGQEPYSIAMLLLERLGQEISEWNINLLGTDIDTKVLNRARSGWFTRTDVEGLPQVFLERYFLPGGGGFCLKPVFQQLVNFEVHNLVSDRPYHGLDLVVCRNVLIYFNPALQIQVLKGFHEGLKEGGFLLLGKVETPAGEVRHLFQCLDTKAKLFRKAGMQNLRQNQVSNRVLQTNTEPVKRPQKVIILAGSAGSINALIQVLSGLPQNLPAAILIIQHLRQDRQTNLPQLLSRHSTLRIHLAKDGLALEEGTAYVALPGQHLRIKEGRLALDQTEPVNYVRPSADVLFTSTAEVFGLNVIGVILSGTGYDGARGCKEIKAKGGVTIAQDEGSSIHFDMPRHAIELNAIDYVLPLPEIAGKIVSLLGQDNKKEEGKI